MLAGVAMTLGTADAATAQVRLSLVPDASVEVRYDDNVDRTETDRVDDVIVSPRAGLSFRARGARADALVRYSIGTNYYVDDTDENGDLDHEASLMFSVQAARHLALRLADGFRVSDTRRTDAEAALAIAPDAPPPPSAPGSLPTRRVRETSNTATLRAEWEATRFTTVDGQYSYELTRYDDQTLVDSDTHRVSAGFDRRVSPVDRLGLAYEAALFTFDSDGPADSWTHEPGLRWTRDLGRDWRGTARVGATFADEQGRGARFSDVTGGLAMTGASKRARYRIAYDRSVRTSGGTGELDVTDSVLLGATREIARWLTGDLGLGFSRNEAIEGRSAATETYSATARLSARLSESWTAFARYAFERADAPAGLESYRVNTVALGLAWTLPGLGDGR